MLDRKKFPFTFEPVAEEWREKLQSEEHALRGYEIIGGNYWYVDHVKQFAIYPVSWISTFIVRCDDGQEYYDFVIIYKERYYKCSADIFYIHKGWNEKNRMKLSLDLKDIEEDIKNAIICCSKHFYYDKKTYENT